MSDDVAIPDLRSRLRLDTSELDRGVAKASGVGSAIGTVIGAGLTKAASAAKNFASNSLRAFTEAEEGAALYNAALAKNPALSAGAADRLDELAGALAKVTKYDDDATKAGIGALAQFKLTEDQLRTLTPRLLDYAQRTGKDTASAAKDLGLAVNGQGRALKKLGIEFKDTGDRAKNFDQLVTALDGTVGGMAKAAGETGAGQLAILNNQFGEVQEEVGSKLLPILMRLSTVLLTVLDFVQRNSAVIGPLVAIVGSIVGAYLIWTKVTAAVTAVQAALNGTLLANPIGLIIVAIAGLVAALVIAYKRSETFRAVVDRAFAVFREKVLPALMEFARVAGAVIGQVVGAFRTSLGGIVNIVRGIIDVVVGLFTGDFGKVKDGVKRAIGGVVQYLSGVPAMILRGLGDLGGTLLSAGGDLIGGFIQGIKNKAGDIISAIKETITDKLPGFVKKALGISSPSKVFAGLGAAVAAGMAVGVLAGVPDVDRAMERLTRVPGVGTTASRGPVGGLPPGGGAPGAGPVEINLYGSDATPEQVGRELLWNAKLAG